jgi:hypothetical protein
MRITRFVQDWDTRWQRWREPDVRRVLVYVRAPMNFVVMAPIYRRMSTDPRVKFYFTTSPGASREADVYSEAGDDLRVISAREAQLMKFDAYLAADFIWLALPRGTRRVQMFHGVAGKWSHIYDRPANSMREWHRLFFINRRRLRNFVAAGALDAGSEAIRLVGMPRSDCLVDGTLHRDAVLESRGLDPSRPTVLYAPTWTPDSSLNAIGEAVVSGLVDTGYTVLVKLHENSFDLAYENSGGVDWAARLTPILQRGTARLIREANASPWLVAADVLITDHSSVGFEYLLLDRPLVRIEMPELINRANVPREYVDLLASASFTVHDASGVLEQVERAFADPRRGSKTRREVAAELFYRPGSATRRAVRELYDVLELTPIDVNETGGSTREHELHASGAEVS